MYFMKWQTWAFTLLLGCMALLAVDRVLAQGGPPKAVPTEVGPVPREVAEQTTFIGRWRVVAKQSNIPKDAPVYTTFEFIQQKHEGLLIASTSDLKNADWYSWNLDSDAKTIDLSARVPGHSIPNQAIYQWDGSRLAILLSVPLLFQGNPGKHARPASFVKPGPLPLYVLEREQIAWGAIENKIQFGVCARPHGLAAIEYGRSVTFQIYVRNTTHDAVEIDINRTDGNPLGWNGALVDRKGNRYVIPGPMGIPGLPQLPSRLKTRLGSYGVAHVGDTVVHFVSPRALPLNIWPQGIVKLEPGEYMLQYGMGWGEKSQTGNLPLTLRERQ